MRTISHTVFAAIFAVSLTVLVSVLLTIPFFFDKESQAGDEMVNLRYEWAKKLAPHPPDPRLVVAPIDQTSLDQLGAWPFSRTVHGQFLQVLAPEKPRVVAWDIFFTEPKTNSTEDQSLVDGARLFAHLVTATDRDTTGDIQPVPAADYLPTQPITHVIGDTSRFISAPAAELPFPALRKVSYFGFVDQKDTAGVRRFTPMAIRIGSDIMPSFDLQVLMQFFNVDADHVTINVGHNVILTRPDGRQIHIPIDSAGQLELNYRANLEDFHALSYVWMGKGLADKSNNVSSPDRDHLPPLRDAILVIGVTFTGTDASPTPLNATSPLVVTHLNALNNILQQDFLLPAPTWAWMAIYGLFVFGIANIMLRVGIVPMILVAILSLVLLAAGAFAALWFGNILAPVVMPEVGLLILAIAVSTQGLWGEGKEKARIKAAMSAYLSEKVMNKVLEHPDNVKLGGIKQEISIMFCDIRGFTQYCDERDPAETVEVLNEYMEQMTQVVFKYDGTIDKYIGDCIMAFWNAPQPQADHAQRAVCCAMEMRYALANFKTKRAGLDRELFECGIGIHTGEALVGNMGSSLKRNYTAMGSTVNLAARLESLTKRLNERILISQAVLDQLQGDFPLTDRGEATVPGFSHPVHVYAVVADQDITSALSVGRALAKNMEYTAAEVTEPIWEPVAPPDEGEPPAG
jgi:adenylate cyclase